MPARVPTEERMRLHASLISLLTGVVVAGVLAVTGWTLAAPGPGAVFADKRPSAVPVDVELVLAVDVSYSMDPEEQALQREGYITGITSRDFMQALRGGQHGKVALTYFEWAGPFDQKIIVPWRLIDGPETADNVASDIARASYPRASPPSLPRAAATFPAPPSGVPRPPRSRALWGPRWSPAFLPLTARGGTALEAVDEVR